ncbi:unnamed protein product, partial [Choristocarpus tenellus]
MILDRFAPVLPPLCVQGGYTDLGGDYGGGFEGVVEQQQGGFDQGSGFQQQAYTSLGDHPQDMGIMPPPEDNSSNPHEEFMRGWEATLREKALLEVAAREAALEAAKAEMETHAVERNSMKEARMSLNREMEQ